MYRRKFLDPDVYITTGIKEPNQKTEFMAKKLNHFMNLKKMKIQYLKIHKILLMENLAS